MNNLHIEKISVYNENAAVLKQVSLSVQSGTGYALLGKGDRAKKLLLRLLHKYNEDTSVYVDADGLPCDAAGFQHISLRRPFGFFRVLEYFDYVYSAEEGGKALKRKQFRDALELLGMEKRVNTKLKKLTDCEYRLMFAALELLKDPDFIILDMDGIKTDRNTKQQLDNAVKNCKANGLGVVCALDSGLVGAAFNQAGVLKDGQMIAAGTPQEIAQKHAPSVYRIDSSTNMRALRKKFAELEAASKILVHKNRILIYTSDEDAAAADIMGLCSKEGVPVKKLIVKAPSLKQSVERLCQ